MADLILPARFNSQPQYRAAVDAGNPITRGLVYAYNPAAGLIDLAGNQANNGFTGTYSLSGMPPNERGIYFDGASYFKVTRNAGYVATSSSPHTMLALCRPTGAGKYMVPVALGEVTDSNYTSAIQIDTASGWLAHKIDSPAAVSTLTTPADTNLCLAVAVRGAADRTFAKNGQLQVNTTSIGGGATAGGMVVGNHFRNSSPEAVQYFVGWIGLVLVWNRTLTDAELHSITVNPWQIFKAPTQRLWPRDSASADVTVALTGQAITASAGTLAPSTSLAATGQAISSSAGTVAPALANAATGQAITAAAGTLAPATSVGATGEAITSAHGNVGAGSDVIVALTGEAITASAGSVTPATANAASGQAITIAAGTLAPATSVAASGQAATASAGTLAPALTLPLAGEAITASAGTVSAGNDVTVALTGQSLTASAGSLGVTVALGISGEAGTVAAGTATAGNSAAASGQSITSGQGTLAPATSIELAGTSITGSAGTVTAQAGSNVTVALIGESITASLGSVVIPVFETDAPIQHTRRVNAARLGPATDAVSSARLGHASDSVPTRRLGARTK